MIICQRGSIARNIINLLFRINIPPADTYFDPADQGEDGVRELPLMRKDALRPPGGANKESGFGARRVEIKCGSVCDSHYHSFRPFQ